MRDSLPSAALILCFPFSYFFVAMYSESLFLLLAVAAFVCFERRLWELSAVCVFLAVLSRPTGLILVPSLLVIAYCQRRQRGAAGSAFSFREALPLAAGPLAWLSFGLYQWVAFGTPFASIRAAAPAPWRRSVQQGVSDLMLHHSGVPPAYLGVLLGIALVFLLFVPLVYRRFGPGYAVFAALAVILPMSTGLISMERYVLVDFPVFACVAQLRRPWPLALAAIGAVYLVVLFGLFVHGAQIF